MQDKLEQYLEKQCHLLDVEVPDDERIWKGISSEMDRHHRFRIRILRAAAVMLLIFSAGVTTLYILKLPHADNLDLNLYQVSQEFTGEENLFRLTVQKKMEEVKHAVPESCINVEMTDQLRQIDRQYETYLEDLRELGNQPRILRGILRCYEMKIRIIDKTLNEIGKKKGHEISIQTTVI